MKNQDEVLTPEEFKNDLNEFANDHYMYVEVLEDDSDEVKHRIKLYFDGRVEGSDRTGNHGSLFGMVHSLVCMRYRKLYAEYEKLKNESK